MKIRPCKGVVAMSGKPTPDSPYAYRTNKRSGTVSTQWITPRDYKKHPVTASESETQKRLQRAMHKMREGVPEIEAIIADRWARRAEDGWVGTYEGLRRRVYWEKSD